jgi:flagellar hook assembly protein FlgD
VYPNPVDKKAIFEYNLAEPASVCLSIYNNLGQQIGIITNESQSAGKHRVQWNAEWLPTGVYYYRIQAGTEIGNGKMIKY